jgi:hypothetical protein
LSCVLIVIEKRDRIFISYASADEQVANRIAECLRSKNKEIWIDKEEITWGDQIVAKINSGLSTSSMGIVILSNNFFKREMPQRELNSMLLLATNMKFRILPLYYDLDHHDLFQLYPLLSDIHGEKADLDCDTLVSKLDNVLNMANEIVNIPIQPQTVLASKHRDDTTNSAKEVSKNEMEEIFTELRRDTTKNRKQATITKLRSYSDSKRIWKHNVTWEIISYLLDSDIIDGLYVIEYMIKFSQMEYPDDLDSIKDNVRERFLPRLLNLIQSRVEKRISGDSFRILRMIIEENTLSRYALAALNTAINELNDNEYFDYIQIYVWHFEKQDLCDFMYDLTLKEDKVGARARRLHDHFFKML